LCRVSVENETDSGRDWKTANETTDGDGVFHAELMYVGEGSSDHDSKKKSDHGVANTKKKHPSSKDGAASDRDTPVSAAVGKETNEDQCVDVGDGDLLAKNDDEDKEDLPEGSDKKDEDGDGGEVDENEGAGAAYVTVGDDVDKKDGNEH
jgi:hypothetical protein